MSIIIEENHQKKQGGRKLKTVDYCLQYGTNKNKLGFGPPDTISVDKSQFQKKIVLPTQYLNSGPSVQQVKILSLDHSAVYVLQYSSGAFITFALSLHS